MTHNHSARPKAEAGAVVISITLHAATARRLLKYCRAVMISMDRMMVEVGVMLGPKGRAQAVEDSLVLREVANALEEVLDV